MRIAYIGLSTPLFYDYRNPASRSPADMSSSPNPILDSPFGLFILYDEIWFLCRSLCPENMRELPYVRFLDERKMLPLLEDIDFSDIWESIRNDPILSKRYDRFRDSFSIYENMVKKIGIYWDAGPDNHTHSLRIGNIQTSANSISLEKLLFDMEVVKRIGREDVEFITNSFSQRFLEDFNSSILRIKFTELLVIKHIPNYLGPEGPYHPCVEEARDSSFLKDFRSWIFTRSLTADENELSEMEHQAEEEIQKLQDEVFLKYLNPKTQYMSIGKTLAGNALDLIASGFSAVKSIAEETANLFDRKKKRWQGFIVSLRYSQAKK